jgi:hypothetical protein
MLAHCLYLRLPSDYARIGNWEDFAETFTVVVAETYIRSPAVDYVDEAKVVCNKNGYRHDIGRRRKITKFILGQTWR